MFGGNMSWGNMSGVRCLGAMCRVVGWIPYKSIKSCFLFGRHTSQRSRSKAKAKVPNQICEAFAHGGYVGGGWWSESEVVGSLCWAIDL